MTDTIENLINLELHLLDAPRDANVEALLKFARRLDALTPGSDQADSDQDGEDPYVAHSLAREINQRLLALQHPYWHGQQPLPAQLQEVMHRRAAAIHARLPKRVPGSFDGPRPEGISIDDVRPNPEKTLDGWGLLPASRHTAARGW